MKLFYSPGACSLSPHIVLREVGLPYKLERVDLKTHTTAGGADFYGINGKGSVPALELDDGRILTESEAPFQREEQGTGENRSDFEPPDPQEE